MYYPGHFCYASEVFREHVKLSTTYFRIYSSGGAHIYKDQVEIVGQKTTHKIHNHVSYVKKARIFQDSVTKLAKKQGVGVF